MPTFRVFGKAELQRAVNVSRFPITAKGLVMLLRSVYDRPGLRSVRAPKFESCDMCYAPLFLRLVCAGTQAPNHAFR